MNDRGRVTGRHWICFAQFPTAVVASLVAGWLIWQVYLFLTMVVGDVLLAFGR